MGKTQISVDHEPINIRHCKQCDAELVPHARFCSACGAVAKSVDVQVTPQETEKHKVVQKWRSIGKANSARADDVSSSAKGTDEAETLTEVSEGKDDVQVIDSVTAEDEQSYTQPHLSAVIAKIGRRQEAPTTPASTPTGQKSLADEASDTPRDSIEDYDTMPQLAEGLEMSQTQSFPTVGTVGKKAAYLPVEARETQRMAAPTLSEGERVESTRGGGGIASALWPLILIVAAIATALLVYAVPGLPIRPYVVLAFLVLCPGMALIRLLRLRDVAVEWTLAIALSVVLSALIPTIQLYAHLWSPDVSLAIILGVTVIGALAQFINPQPHTIKKVEPA